MSRNRGDKEEGKSFSGKGKDTYKDSRHEKAWAHRGRGGGGTKTTLKRLKNSKPGPGLWVNASKGGATPVGLHLEW